MQRCGGALAFFQASEFMLQYPAEKLVMTPQPLPPKAPKSPRAPKAVAPDEPTLF